MSNILVFAEQRDGQLKSYALEAISEGRRLADGAGGTLSVCVIGAEISDLSTSITGHGADTILIADNAGLAVYSPGAYAKLLRDALTKTGTSMRSWISYPPPKLNVRSLPI